MTKEIEDSKTVEQREASLKQLKKINKKHMIKAINL
jgi:hypothetical protein